MAGGAFLGEDVDVPVPARAAFRAEAAAATVLRHVRASRDLLPALARSHARGEAPEFAIDLARDLELRARVFATEATAGGGVAVSARILAPGDGVAVLVQNGSRIVGSVTFTGGAYRIETAYGTVDRIERVHPHLLPPEAPPALPPAGRATTAPGRTLAKEASSDAAIEADRLIDLMVVYTPLARAEAGGADPTAIESLIDLGVAETNAAYLISGVAQRLRLVHTQEVAYVEANHLRTDLDAITFPGDGALDDVHALRDTHGADLVQLVVGGAAGCGIAWLLDTLSTGQPQYGFSVTLWTCISPNYTFGHELGHNMGLMHDPYAVAKYGEGAGPAPYGYGFVDVARRWRTVMAYRDQCADQAGVDCTRVLVFSTPKFAFDGDGPGGQPPGIMGTANENHNAHVLNRTAQLVAAYRPTSPLHPLPQRFTDVPASHPFQRNIEFLAQAAISTGCAHSLFCPDDPVTRDQAAVLLERAMRASNWSPPPPSGLFTDVPVASPFAPWIEALRNDAITAGCTATQYCPSVPATRAQIAALLLRSRCGATFVPLAPAGATFADVPTADPFHPFIERIYALGISAGCASSPLRYCPDAAVTRGQIAAFLDRSYPFPTPSEACAP